MSNRNELAEKLELVGAMFEIDGMSELLKKFTPETDDKGRQVPINNVKFNSIVIQIESLLMKNNPEAADKIVSMNTGKSVEEVGKIEDAEYARLLRIAITTDVLGFFGSSPATGGKK